MEVVGTDEFEAWYLGLTEPDQAATYRVVSLLETLGLGLGHPYSSAINGSKYALRELRVQSMGHPLRIFYAFDPRRDAVLILGGDKTGDDRFYERMVPLCEGIFATYLAEQAAGEHQH